MIERAQAQYSRKITEKNTMNGIKVKKEAIKSIFPRPLSLPSYNFIPSKYIITEEMKKELQKNAILQNKFCSFDNFSLSVFEKTDNDIRKNYISKLISNNVLKIIPFKKKSI